ncbi:oxaloacetate decarboxylase [Streptomyces sp. A30]|uniref:isocitrate lyase/PEP mutase family protein n=1 Tax=Streptomyces sp. A30 TaxID=2789273 RepID=UPI00397FF937
MTGAVEEDGEAASRVVLDATVRFRQLLGSGRLIVAPGAFDPFTARITESLGFPAVYLGGNAMGIHLGTGQPFITLTETVDCAVRTRRLVESPLIVDAGAGFGDPAHTYRTVRELEAAGAAAIHIDDQPSPKRAHYHLGKGRVVPLPEIVDKLRVAVSARRNPDFVLIARTDAYRTQSRTETLARAQALAETGIDMLMVLNLPLEDAPLFRRELPSTPLVWIGGHRAPMPTVSEIEGAGFQLAVYPFTTVTAVADSVTRTWSTVLTKGRPDHTEDLLAHTRQQAMDLIGMDEYYKIEKQTTERDDPDNDMST